MTFLLSMNHAAYILAAYGVTALGVLGLVIPALIRLRRARSRLAVLESAGRR